MQGTYEFMSDGILTAAEYHDDYLQSPVDDLFSFYYTMQWAAVFHNQEFSTKDVPSKLEVSREKLSGTQDNRLLVTSNITALSPLEPDEYGTYLVNCQPMLRAWYSELQVLFFDWKKCRRELQRRETNAEIYKSLFLTFAVRGVATLAELVHKYTKDMD